eukprot:scaffold1889_cov198-Amphora_coffeaeformis.AAC.5
MAIVFDSQENDDGDESTQHEEQPQGIPSDGGCMIVDSQGGRRTRRRYCVRFDETPTFYEYDKVTECEKALVWYNRREEELMHRHGEFFTQSPWDEWIRFRRLRHRPSSSSSNNGNKEKLNNDVFIRMCIMLGFLWIIFDSLTASTKMYPQVVKLGSDEGRLDVAGDLPTSSKKDEL